MGISYIQLLANLFLKGSIKSMRWYLLRQCPTEFFACVVLIMISNFIFDYIIYPNNEPDRFEQLYIDCRDDPFMGDVMVFACMRNNKCTIRGSYIDGFSCVKRYTVEALTCIFMSSIIIIFTVPIASLVYRCIRSPPQPELQPALIN